jgi:transposase-like protein
MSKSPSVSQPFPVREFFARFPNEEACLVHLMNVRFGGTKMDCPDCGVEGEFHKLRDRRVYACPHCLFQIAPTANTIFHDTRTPLVSWFYAIYLFVVTRHGVSGKELQRQLGVTYKTAWRMGMQIRTLIGSVDEFTAMKGHVEIDETFVGGKAKRPNYRDNKTIVVGIKERGGPMRTEIVQDVSRKTLRRIVLENVQPKTTVSTDEWRAYRLLTADDYQHGAVNHSADEWARVDPETGVNHHVQHVESFWSMFKRSVKSTHIHISAKHMSRYLDEFTFRSNHRQMGNAMFDLMLGAV